MNKKILLFLLLPLFILSCEEEDYSQETKILSDYLLLTFREKIAQEPHYYFIISSTSCLPCVKEYMKILDEQDAQSILSKVTIITTIPVLANHEYKNKFHLLFDQNGELNYLNLYLCNLTVFKTEKGAIQDIARFNVDKKSNYKALLDKIMGAEL